MTYYPIGTVVKLIGGNRPLMIYGRRQKQESTVKKEKNSFVDSPEEEKKVYVDRLCDTMHFVWQSNDAEDYVAFDISNFSNGMCNYPVFKPFLYELFCQLFEGYPTIATVCFWDKPEPIKKRKPFHLKYELVYSEGIHFAENVLQTLEASNYPHAYGSFMWVKGEHESCESKYLRVFNPTTTKKYIYDVYERNDNPVTVGGVQLGLSIETCIPDAEANDISLPGNAQKKKLGIGIYPSDVETTLSLVFNAKLFPVDEMLDKIKRTAETLSMNLEVNI